MLILMLMLMLILILILWLWLWGWGSSLVHRTWYRGSWVCTVRVDGWLARCAVRSKEHNSSWRWWAVKREERILDMN